MQRESIIARSYLTPIYAVPCTEHITVPRSAWWDVPEKRWAYRLIRMTVGKIIWLDGIEVYHGFNGYQVEGQSLSFDATIKKLRVIRQKMKEVGYKPLPYFKLGKRQKAVLRFWMDYRTEHGEYPSVTQTVQALDVCNQQISNIMYVLMEYGLVSQQDADARGGWQWIIEEEAIEQMGFGL